MAERRRSGGYVTRPELRQLEEHWRERWERLTEALSFYDQMCELGLRELLPIMLRSERLRQAAGVLREDRYRWVVRVTAYALPATYLVAVVGGAMAIARTLGWLR